MHVFLGTDTGEGIYRARWNAATGEIGPAEIHAEMPRPVYFAQHPVEPILYVANELGGGKALVSSLRIEGAGLKALQQVSCDDGPCYVSVDRENVYVANYSSGSFEIWSQAKGGFAGSVARAIRPPKFSHPGPVADRQDNPHFHCAVLAPGGGHILVCDLGSDQINIVSKPGAQGELTHTVVPTRPGAGPRHVVFHPNGRWFYCIYELDSTIDLYDWSVSAGKASATRRKDWVISTLTPGTPLTGNTACEVLISPDGRFVYACNRGVDDLVVYRVDAHTGLLTEQQRLSAGGPVPRIITFDPSRRWLVACNQGRQPKPVGNLAVFAHDPATGHLTFAHNSVAETPMCIHWA